MDKPRRITIGDLLPQYSSDPGGLSQHGRGKRLFVIAKIPINEALSVLIFATQAVDHAATNVPQQRIDVGLYYNVSRFFE